MEIPRHWRLKAQRYRLQGSLCTICGQPTFPPRPICPLCTAQPAPTAGCELLIISPSNRIVETVLSKRMTG